MNKAIMLAAILALGPLPAHSQNVQDKAGGETQAIGEGAARQGERAGIGAVLDFLSRSQLKDRLAAATGRVREACGADIEELCGSETEGGGRIAACVRENADELSTRCRITLALAVRGIQREVANFADECGNAIRAQCGGAEKVGECAEKKSAAISPACHTMVTALRQASTKLSSLKGVTVFSSDGKDVGRVVDAVRGPDGKLQSVQIQIGQLLGLGDKVVSISADRLQELGNRIQLRMNADQLRSLPEAKRQGG
ncbi:MAG: PRC-barrel domain-containing protein [Rhodomicrobium sp.]